MLSAGNQWRYGRTKRCKGTSEEVAEMTKLPGIAAHRPKCSEHRGATWDTLWVYLPDGTRTEGHVDTTWGKYIYFQVGESWRKVEVRHADSLFELDLRGGG